MRQASGYFDLYNSNPNDCIIQDKIVGTEYTVTVSSNKTGQLIQVVPLKVLQKKGVTISAIHSPNNKIRDLIAQLCEIFCPEGIFNVQLIENQNGELYIFEVNPRISTTACLAVHLGYDPIKIILIIQTILVLHSRKSN